MKDRFGGQHHRHQSTCDAQHLVLTWPSCSWHWHWSPGARDTSLHSVVTKHRLASLTQSHQWPHSLPGPHLSESAELQPEDWNICSACCSAAELATFTVKKYHNYVELLTHVSPTLSPDDTTIQWVLKHRIHWFGSKCQHQHTTYKSERSGGINLSKTLQQIIIEGCYREVLQKPHNPVSANPSAFKDLAMQTHAAQVWRTGTHTIYHTLITVIVNQTTVQCSVCNSNCVLRTQVC